MIVYFICTNLHSYFYSTKLLSHLTLHSQRSILKTDINCYSVACLYDGKFCISSLHDSLSFLPTYEHKEQTKKPFKNTGSGGAIILISLLVFHLKC